MTSKEKLQNALDHKEGPLPLDLGATAVTGLHVNTIRNLRIHFGLEDHPVKVWEPYQMLGEVEDDLMEAMGIDMIGVVGKKNMFGIENEGWRPMQTFWGQEVLVPAMFNTSVDEKGNLLIHPEGDRTFPPTAKMPRDSYFFDALNRQKPFVEADLKVEDNLEEFNVMSEDDISHFAAESQKAAATGKGVIATFGGTAFGDIALVPAMQLKDPRGIRDVSEWYMSTIMRQDYVHGIFEGQSEIAIRNLELLKDKVGDQVQAVFICGTDFGTQDSQFCDLDTFNSLYAPYYKKINDWIHQHTSWKTFKHSCGAVKPFMKAFIEAGFDIINPVQINARDMVPEELKKEFGRDLVFWGGGVDTQVVLPFGKPEEVADQVKHACDVFGKDGGFVFNTVHNIQANVPVDNIVAMLDALRPYT